MRHISRRRFVTTVGVSAGLAGTTTAGARADTGTRGASRDSAAGLVLQAASTTTRSGPVLLSGDGLSLTPREYAALLERACQATAVAEDSYLLGGEVERFERAWATLLGKETAVFMPSGTLANHLALRALAGAKRRVIVPEMSHVYNDTGDACQTLSGLTLVPLAPGAATFTTQDVEQVLARTASGRVATDVGAILIESPLRRLSGEMFDWDEAGRITTFARERGIGTHLDGARLFIASAYTGISPAAYAAPFDTVYVSLWKYFNCGIGAILAGPARVLEGMFHTRRMFGGNLAVGWQAALVAQTFMEGFVDRLTRAVRLSEEFYTAIAQHPRVTVERIPHGTNLTRLRLRDVDRADVSSRLAQRGVHLPSAPGPGAVVLAVNESWNRTTAADLVRAFEHALGSD